MTDLPRVSTILRHFGLDADYSGVRPATLEYARWRGTEVHAAIEAAHYGFLPNEATLAPDVLVRLNAYRRFVKDSGFRMTHVETFVTHAVWGYCGHPDGVGFIGTTRTLLDWKCMDAIDLAAPSLQLAAYRLAWNAQREHEPVAAAAVLQLKSDGAYRLHEVDLAEHESLWRCVMVVWRAQQARLAA
jgi:hypothetical protein